ncbi:hypothetical protein AKJ57_02075 [candidate division MSBL1 archaeon SCGC-AAA259A05]|uniref:Fibronectin type-III domain-containing protein n=1 Tax=candidate division MSBL1 archaeon SCGC-AAA259A05 TaxID=1698259 RepID=A0A133UAH8_9EURY|nr:hypothetical protein AKJ57_02075 [candidate division MSBL1 archaeon SCGC-AAA259A05]
MSPESPPATPRNFSVFEKPSSILTISSNLLLSVLPLSRRSWVGRSGSGSYSKEISGLSSGTDYEFYAQVSFDGETKSGSTLTFTTATKPFPWWKAISVVIAAVAIGIGIWLWRRRGGSSEGI